MKGAPRDNPAGAAAPKIPEARIPEELVESLLNRELDEGSREKVFAMLRRDPRACEDLARTQRVVSMLRTPIEAPDFRAAVMERVGAKRGFLPERLRRVVKRGRLAVGACGLLVLLGAAAAQRYAPEWTELTARPRPVTAVLRAGTADAAAGAERLANAIGAVRQHVGEPVAELSRTVALEVRVATDDLRRPVAVTLSQSTIDEAPRVVYMVEPLSPGPVTTVRLLGTAGGTPTASVVCTGAADASAFPAPKAVLGECRTAVLLPVSNATMCWREGSGAQATWVRAAPGAAFVMPSPRDLTYFVSSFASDTASGGGLGGLARRTGP